jgi:hypothetical protein
MNRRKESNKLTAGAQKRSPHSFSYLLPLLAGNDRGLPQLLQMQYVTTTNTAFPGAAEILAQNNNIKT